MNRQQNYLFCLVLISILMFGMGENAAASCVCHGTEALPKVFESADMVLIARFVSTESSGANESKIKVKYGPNVYDIYYNDYQAENPSENFQNISTLIVEKTYKGDIAAGEKLVLIETSRCSWLPRFQYKGEKHLLYIKKLGANKAVIEACGRSTLMDHRYNYAAGDLLYLDKLSEVQEKNRLSGRLLGRKDSKLTVFSDRKIKVQNQLTKESLELITDKNGIFETYDLPQGKYVIEIEIPNGWILTNSMLNDGISCEAKNEDIGTNDVRGMRIMLGSIKKCTTYDDKEGKTFLAIEANMEAQNHVDFDISLQPYKKKARQGSAGK